MPQATYTLEAELSYNTWTDITVDWLISEPLRITRGIEPGQQVAGIGEMALSLYNPDGRYTPGHASATAGFETGIGLRLKANDGTSTYTLFYGRLTAISPRRDASGRSMISRRVDIRAEDEIAALHRMQVEVFPLLIDVGAGEIVNRLIDASFTPPGLSDYWRINHPEAAKLGTGTTLAGTLTGKSLDDGQGTFPWVGDSWGEGFNAIRSITEAVISEGGTFHITADGTPTYRDRHTRPKQVTADADLSGGLAVLVGERADRRVTNRIEVTVYPRTVGEMTVVLWSAGTPISLKRGEVRKVIARYVDPDQESAWIGALSITPLEEGIDYYAYRDRDVGGPQDVTEHLHVDVEYGATATIITLTNQHPNRKPIIVDVLQVRGIPLRAYLPISVIIEDGSSQFDHGLRSTHLQLPLQDDTDIAGEIARALLVNRKDPHDWLVVEVEATVSTAMLTHALAREVGDRIQLTDSTLDLDERGAFIEKIGHVITGGGESHRVTWQTSPADLSAYWALGTVRLAELGETTLVGY